MTELEAIQEALGIWERRARGLKDDDDCSLCVHGNQEGTNCTNCPWFKEYGYCLKVGSPVQKWFGTEAPKEEMKYAGQVVAMLEKLE